MPDKRSVGDDAVRFACDAMCGGLARWLRALGYDASYVEGIDDAQLVQQALAEDRVIISADGRLFERRPITTRQVRALRLPRGLKRQAQLEYVIRAMHLPPLIPRCTQCGGPLVHVRREEVADRVPARSLLSADHFHRCERCGHVFWDGTHWRRIDAVRKRCEQLLTHDDATKQRPPAASSDEQAQPDVGRE